LGIIDQFRANSAIMQAFQEKYELSLTSLGEGEYGRVKLGLHKETSTDVAVKVVRKSRLREDDIEAVMQEVDILKSLSTSEFGGAAKPHFVQMYDFFEMPRQFVLVMEYMEGGELFDRIVERAYYSEQDARETCKTLLEAVRFLHDRNVCHRDLKPENLLLKDHESDSNIKIADFGFAKRVENTELLSTQCGTPGYVSPEIVKGEKYGLEVDMWSVGVILFILLGGYPPFIADDQKELFRMIKKADFEFDDMYWVDITSPPKDLITRLLEPNARDRYHVDKALAHPWFHDGETVPDSAKNLGASLNNLRKFNGKRKLRSAVRAITITNRMERWHEAVNRHR